MLAAQQIHHDISLKDIHAVEKVKSNSNCKENQSVYGDNRILALGKGNYKLKSNSLHAVNSTI